MTHTSSPITCRGVRGATTAAADSPEAILGATERLLRQIIAANDIAVGDIASAFFTVTPDLTAAHPPRAARLMGWEHVAMLTAQEMAVPGGLERAIRVLLHWNTTRSQAEIRHIYIEGAEVLRPDWANQAGADQPNRFT